MMLRRLLERIPMWKRGNLLDEEVLAEVHILVPRDGSPPKMFTPKSENPSDKFVYAVTQAVVNAAMDFAKLYGVSVAGFLGQPVCPHCQKMITGPPEPPRQ